MIDPETLKRITELLGPPANPPQQQAVNMAADIPTQVQPNRSLGRPNMPPPAPYTPPEFEQADRMQQEALAPAPPPNANPWARILGGAAKGLVASNYPGGVAGMDAMEAKADADKRDRLLDTVRSLRGQGNANRQAEMQYRKGVYDQERDVRADELADEQLANARRNTEINADRAAMEGRRLDASLQPPPPEPFTLSPGQVRFDPSGQQVANNPAAPGSTHHETVDERALAAYLKANPGKTEWDYIKAKDAAINPNRPPPTGNPAQDRRTDNWASKFASEPITKTYNTVTNALQFVRSVPDSNQNPAYDQALIYAFAKAMDPDSVVREGEYATVQKYAQSWLQSFGFNAQRVLSNSEFLSAEARRNMKRTIEERAKPVIQQYGNLRRSYGDQINRITGGTDGESYLPDYGAAFGPAPAGSTGNTAGAGPRGGGTPAAQGGVAPEGHVVVDANGNKLIKRNGQWVRQP